MLKGGIIKRGLTERKINAIFEVTYMTDGSGVYHGEYKGLKPTVWAVQFSTMKGIGLPIFVFLSTEDNQEKERMEP